MNQNRYTAHPQLPQMLIDASIWMLSVPAALFLRLLDLDASSNGYRNALILGMLCAVFQVSVGFLSGLYTGKFRFATFDEFKGITQVTFIVSIFPILVGLSGIELLPRSIGFISLSIALVWMFAARFLVRLGRERKRKLIPGTPTLIYGAGEIGIQLLTQIMQDRNSRYSPVGFIDDDIQKRKQAIFGLRVHGNFDELAKVLSTKRIEMVIIAISNIDSVALNKIYQTCLNYGAAVRIVPSLSELFGKTIKLDSLTSVSEEDLIGRRTTEVDEGLVSAFLSGKRILITGAGGSIGSEIARQVHRYNPSRVAMLDRDETLLQTLQLSLDGKGLLSSDNLILADIRDENRMYEVMEKEKPEIIFHAAALKHLSMLEMYPEEGFKTNVKGTENVLKAATKANVPCFINISTDKAVNPTSTLGRTKHEAENLTKSSQPANSGIKYRYMSVRFGNVLGSRGSVLDTFRFQISRGGPITITDPDVTRFFMTIPEAVHLVLEASAIGNHGEILVLKMGQPVRILDLAQKLIALSGQDIGIEISGLRIGEKKTEELFSSNEKIDETHERVLRINDNELRESDMAEND